MDYVAIQKAVAAREPFDSVIEQVQQYQSQIAHIPALLRQDPDAMAKAWKTLSTEKASKAPKSAFFDPLSLQYALGYKDRRYNLTYETLKRISTQLSLVAAIINTRIAQIASFSQPYRTTKSLGYIIRHKEAERLTTNSERRFIQQLEAFIAACGEPGRENPYTRIKRPKFEHFLKQIVRDSLTYDQICAECVPRNNGIPFEFRAVDASTIRIASPDRDSGTAYTHSMHQRNLIPGMTGPLPYRYGNMYIGQQYGREQLPPDETVQYVQVINGQIENVYTDKELMFGVRNPRTDIYVQGYGFGELEQLITIVTSILYSEEFNRRFFCIAPNTLITTNEGLTPVDALVGKEFNVWNGVSWVPAKAYETGKKPLVRTKLWNGLVLETSPLHKFRAIPKESETGEVCWIEQRSLKEGDIILVGCYRSDPSDSKLDELLLVGESYETDRRTGRDWCPSRDLVRDVEFWEMIGFALGDGYWPHLDERAVGWLRIFPHYEKDKDLFSKFLSCCNRHNIHADQITMNKHMTRIDGNSGYPVIQICHKAFVEWLYDLGFVSSNNNRVIPQLLYKLPAWVREAILRGLFSADGHCQTHITGYRTPTVFSADSNFRKDIITCLWSVGIVANEVGKGWRRKGTIVAQDVNAFVERIGYLQEYKNKGLHRSKSSSGRWDRIHPALGHKLAGLLRNHESWLSLEHKDRLDICAVSRNAIHMTRSKWINYLSKLNIEIPEALYYCHVPVDVLDSQSIDEIQMFDIEVMDDNHLFLANHMAVHNTQGAHPKGILNFKGDNWTPDQLECIAGDTLVSCNIEGTDYTTPIQDLFVKQETHSCHIKFWNGEALAPGFVSQAGIKPVVVISTESGIELKATGNHRMFISDNCGLIREVFVSDLNIGDYLIRILDNKSTANGIIKTKIIGIYNNSPDEMTYDVTISKDYKPRFIANGLLTHNSFKRQWVAQVAGAENSWKTPITQSEGLEWVNMQMTNQDMQFNIWLEYLIKVTSAVFLIDPAEINFDLHGGVQQTPLFESSQEWKLKASRDRGLKPLLRFIAGLINENIIDRIDDHFVFEFIGLDELTEQEKHDMMKEQISSYMTLNETRRTLDLPDIPGGVGELPLNPVLLQLLQFLDGKKQREDEAAKQAQMEQQQQAMAAQQGQQIDEQGQPVGGAPGGPEGQQEAPSELEQTKVAAAQQKMQMQANKHPLELAYLRHKIVSGGGQLPPSEEQQAQPEEEAPVRQVPQYTDLVGKSKEIDFDAWLDQMRNKL